jgi:hypothetical protein
MHDLHNNLHFKQAFFTGASDNTAASGSIDRQGFNSLELLINTGSLADADATFTLAMKESTTGAFGGEENDVAAAELIGTLALASFDFSKDNCVFKIGYRGAKRYVKAIVTPANNTGLAQLVGTWILGAPVDAPTANPPQ